MRVAGGERSGNPGFEVAGGVQAIEGIVQSTGEIGVATVVDQEDVLCRSVEFLVIGVASDEGPSRGESWVDSSSSDERLESAITAGP